MQDIQYEIRFHSSLKPYITYAVASILGLKLKSVVSSGSFAPVMIEMRTNDGTIRGDEVIARYLIRTTMSGDKQTLCGTTPFNQSKIEQWEHLMLSNAALIESLLPCLDKYLMSHTFFAAFELTLADICVWGALKKKEFKSNSTSYPQLSRWFDMCQEVFGNQIEKMLVAETKPKAQNNKKASKKKENGKKSKKGLSAGAFQPLKNAVVGEVVTRFPPEPSGYLHIGHCKALMLNWEYSRFYKGKMILRFDDTNPSKEKGEYVDSFIRDIAVLGVKPDKITHTSDSFDIINDYAMKLLKEGKAYMDNTSVDVMRDERMKMIESKYRNVDVETNLEKYRLMHSGKAGGEVWCMRAKIDMKSVNGTLRDPVLYRANYETPHVRTGVKYKAYPTYDLACPIVDSIEGVTHAMRTTEYNDRAAQFNWIIDALELRKPHLQEFARMSFQYTLMSKRKLQWFVDQNLVEGWNDPRFPTIQGAIRRGVTVECLKDFVISQGFSKRIVEMEWDKFWSVNNKIIDAKAERFMAIFKDTAIEMNITNVSEYSSQKVARHPKNKEMGERDIFTGPVVYVEREDCVEMKAGDEVVLMRWGLFKITSVSKDATSGTVISVDAEFVPNGIFKKKKTMCWLAKSESLIDASFVEFDHLITKSKLSKTDDYMSYLTPTTRMDALAIADSGLKQLKKGSVIQIERRGFYIVDSAYDASEGKPMVLFMIPDGKKKAMSTLSFKLGHH